MRGQQVEQFQCFSVVTLVVNFADYISAIAIVIAFVLALVGAVAKLSNNGLANALASFYTSFFRGVPLLIQGYDGNPAVVGAVLGCLGALSQGEIRTGTMGGSFTDEIPPGAVPPPKLAVSALVNLGYKRIEAFTAVREKEPLTG